MRKSKPKQTEEAPPAAPHSGRFPLVGLGASAGGIQALQTFFEGMPANSGMAFVVVMHLSPDYESNLAQVLQLNTQMPVIQVTEEVKVEPDHVYVIPPNKHLSLRDSILQLVEPQQPVGRRVAIDFFFRTLSVAYAQRAVAIVLSGTDSDGVIGIKHIKEQGGLTIVQDPTEAEFDSMPRGAIETGMVDWVLPVAEMPPRLMEFVRNEQRMHVPPEETPEEAEEDGNSGGPLLIRQVAATTDEEALAEVLRFLKAQTGHDFSYYKRATVLRRVARRLQVNLLEDIPTYLHFLRTHNAEVNALLHDLLISVTNFFRDRESFTALENHIAQLFAGKGPGEQVRVWVVGCATGEEAYSVAMLLYEHAARLDNPPSIQVFATDLDEEVIQIARSGLYPATIEADVSQERLRRFFQKEQGRYRIRKEIRELVLFSVHDVLKDSPFSRLDLITCRNLLIYLKRDAQERVFSTFHFALRPGGLLFLGGSESVDDTSILFAALDKRHRLFVCRAVSQAAWQLPPLPLAAVAQRTTPSPVLPRTLPFQAAPVLHDPSAIEGIPAPERRGLLAGDLHLALLEQYAPPSVIVNENYDILHLSEHAARFLQFAGGEPSMNLVKVVLRDLRIELRTALFRAAQSGASISTPRVPVEIDGTVRPVTVHVRPVRKAETEEGFLLVVFELASDTVEAAGADAAVPEPITRHLEGENQHLKEQLSATIEQYEASVEELKASNEELQAMNEEMRSAAEELETSKEELQSINEELTTVNQELKSNVEELSRANSDLQNLMASTEIGTVFLDRRLRIKRFTPRVQELFNIIATDTGRPLSDLTHRLNYPELAEDAERVLRDLHRSEREVRSNAHWFLARMLPYRTLDDRIEGVVLTLIDITERKKIEEALRASEERYRLTVENTRDYAIFTLDLEGRITSSNEGARRIGGYEEAEIIGRHFRLFYTKEDQEAGKPERELEEAARTGRSEDEEWRVRKDGSRFWSNEITTAVYDAKRTLVGFVKIARDLTGRKHAEEEYRTMVHESTLLAERNRMAQELHDTLAQGFTGIKLQIDVAEAALSNGAAQTEVVREALTHIVRARDIAQKSMLDARSAIRALRAGLLDSNSLPEAFQRLAEDLSASIQVGVEVEGTPYPLSGEIENDMYRIGQEAITNALRHAHVEEVSLRLRYAPGQLELLVRDSGQGFDQANRPSGFGLTGMHERAARIGGELVVTSQPGKGTEIAVTVKT